LVRAGRDYYPFLGTDGQWARKYSVELGYVKHTEIGRVLSLADFLIQPGTADQFNEYRLPSKLPEFFAMGRPVVLPRTNVGRFAVAAGLFQRRLGSFFFPGGELIACDHTGAGVPA